MKYLTATALMLLCGASAAVEAAQVVVFRFDDNVHEASRAYLERCLDEAQALGADLVVMEIDTPGGFVSTTRDITSAISSSRIPVVVWVTPAGAHAASAGFYILLSADVAAMAPGTNTGAATPVLVPMVPSQGDAEPSEEMKAKITNDATAMIRSFAGPRGRNVDLAVKAVTEALSFTAEEALEENLIDIVAPNLDDLLDEVDGLEIRRLDGSSVTVDLEVREITRFELTALERFQSALAQPLVAFLLMAAAAIGLYTEITNPGAIVPGVVGAIALLLFLYSTSILSVNVLGIVLIAMALVLFALEVKVTSFGLLTAGGIACFVLGSILLFDAPIPEMQLSLGVVIPTAILLAVTMVFLLSRVVTAHRRRPATGREGLVGKEGVALTELAPAGKVLVHGEYWDADATADVPARAPVRVVEVQERRLKVEPVDTTQGG